MMDNVFAPPSPQPADRPLAAPAGVSPRIGRYEILGRIGVGGMAEVFRARAHGPSGYQRELIIKRILPQLAADPNFIRAFVDEAKILGMLNHPNIVGAYDFGEDNGRHYLALEYLDGPSLAELMRRHQDAGVPIPVGVAALIAREVCQGLAAVHALRQPNGARLDVIHRDVTPSNVLTTRSGAVKLLDFGIAKINTTGTLTRHGQIKGKAAYLAPEQIQGTAIDARVDLFALGIVLHELLTLRHLFHGEGGDVAAAYRIMEMPIPRPSELRADVPEGLDAIVMKALARDADQRYGSALEMGKDLGQIVRDAGVRQEDLARFIVALTP
ncbi:MAG: serine/threonine-protein kinase [Pseudomonadota bacterium]